MNLKEIVYNILIVLQDIRTELMRMNQSIDTLPKSEPSEKDKFECL